MSATVDELVETNPIMDLNILSIDAGGPQGISQLIILKNIMESLHSGSEETVKRPCEVFHAIGGAGTGGIISILLVVLKMTAAEALEEFTNFVSEVFKSETMDPKKRTEMLQRVIENILERHGLDKSVRLIARSDAAPTCKLILPVMYKNHVGVPCVLRNYVARHEPPTDLTIAEAMLATCATPPIFSPVTIYKDFGDFDYIGGEVGLSNPTNEVIAEAHRAFGNEVTVACLLSLGSGRLGIHSSPLDSSVATWTDFLDRVSTHSERTAAEIAARMQRLALYHRISVDYGMEARGVHPCTDLAILAAHTTTYLSGGEVVELLGRCVETIKHGDGFTTLEQLRHSGGAKLLPPALPPLTSHYVERKEATEFIEKALLEEDGGIKPGSKIIVVTGIGGCGKTQLVRKFVKKHGDRFITAFFVDGSSEESIQRDIVRYVRSLGTVHSQSSFNESMTFLSQRINGQRLLVIDNVDDPTVDLAPCLPQWPNGAVVVTSRDASRGQLSTRAHLELDVMTLDEAVELLVCGSRQEWPPSNADKEAAVAVAKELGCHPIAVVQAISYMANTGYSAGIYIARLRAFREPVLNNPATSQVNMRYKTAFAAFDASYEILPPRAQKALQLLSLFHWRNFCLELVILAGENGFSTEKYNYIPRGEEFECGREHLTTIFCSSGEWNPLELDRVIASLRNHSLVTTVSTGNATLLQMHPLVHEWARLRGTPDELEKSRDAAIRLLCCGATEDNHYMIQYLYLHIQVLSSAWDGLHANDALALASILHQAGLYTEAAKLRETACVLVKNLLGVDHPDTINTTANLAVTYGKLGRYADKQMQEEKVLSQRTELLGVDHPDTIRATANLAVTYGKLGRYADEQRLEEKVLPQGTELLGVDHPDTIRAAANLAVTYGKLGRYADEQRLEEKVLRQRTELLGVDHPDTIRAAANLAVTYGKLGRYADEQMLEEKVLQQRTELLGVDHPDTIRAAANLAVTYGKLGRYADEQRLEEKVLRQRTELLGVDHPDTIRAAANLALTYGNLGRYADEQRLEEKVLPQRTELLGVDHPDTIRATANLALTYGKLGRYADEQRLEEKVLRQRTELLGVDHPDTIRAAANLALTYGKLGRYADEQRLEEKVLRQRTELLGVDHPDTIRATANLAVTYGKLGRYAEKQMLEEKVLRQRTELLGVDHPDTIRATANLAVTYGKLGRYAAEQRLEEKVLRQRTELLGVDHPDTIRATANLAVTYGKLGRYADEQGLEEKVLRQRTELLGVDHPDTIRAVGNLARTYRRMKRYIEAEELGTQAFQQCKRILGEDHPDTLVGSLTLAEIYYELGRYQEAEALEVDGLRRTIAIQGEGHLDTLSMMYALARTYKATGRRREATELARNATQTLLETLGETNPLYIEVSTFLASLVEEPSSRPRRRDRVLAYMRKVFPSTFKVLLRRT